MNRKITISMADASDTGPIFPVDDPQNWFKVLVPLPGDWPRVRFCLSHELAVAFAQTEADDYGYDIDDQTGGALA